MAAGLKQRFVATTSDDIATLHTNDAHRDAAEHLAWIGDDDVSTAMWPWMRRANRRLQAWAMYGIRAVSLRLTRFHTQQQQDSEEDRRLRRRAKWRRDTCGDRLWAWIARRLIDQRRPDGVVDLEDARNMPHWAPVAIEWVKRWSRRILFAALVLFATAALIVYFFGAGWHTQVQVYAHMRHDEDIERVRHIVITEAYSETLAYERLVPGAPLHIDDAQRAARTQACVPFTHDELLSDTSRNGRNLTQLAAHVRAYLAHANASATLLAHAHLGISQCVLAIRVQEASDVSPHGNPVDTVLVWANARAIVASAQRQETRERSWLCDTRSKAVRQSRALEVRVAYVPLGHRHTREYEATIRGRTAQLVQIALDHASGNVTCGAS